MSSVGHPITSGAILSEIHYTKLYRLLIYPLPDMILLLLVLFSLKYNTHINIHFYYILCEALHQFLWLFHLKNVGQKIYFCIMSSLGHLITTSAIFSKILHKNTCS